LPFVNASAGATASTCDQDACSEGADAGSVADFLDLAAAQLRDEMERADLDRWQGGCEATGGGRLQAR
jgi:hypothetical protein